MGLQLYIKKCFAQSKSLKRGRVNTLLLNAQSRSRGYQVSLAVDRVFGSLVWEGYSETLIRSLLLECWTGKKRAGTNKERNQAEKEGIISFFTVFSKYLKASTLR